jgi:Spy/CpxP family protein refolding chaperone
MHGQIIRLAACALVLAMSPGWAVQASEQALADEQLTAARDELQAGRRQIIAEELRLDAAQDAAFWPIYDQYQQQVMEVRDRYARAVTDYLQRHRAGEISETDAARFVDEGLAFKQDLLDVRRNYLKKFKRALPIRKVARFYQIENKLDVEVDAQLALAIPLMDPV